MSDQFASPALPGSFAPGTVDTSSKARLAAFADNWLPRVVLGPTILISLIFVYGFIGLTGFLSLTESRLMPRYEYAGFGQYEALFELDRWWVAATNLGIFGGLFILFCLVVGLLLAVFLDRKSTRLNSSHIQKSRMPSSA